MDTQAETMNGLADSFKLLVFLSAIGLGAVIGNVMGVLWGLFALWIGLGFLATYFICVASVLFGSVIIGARWAVKVA